MESGGASESDGEEAGARAAGCLDEEARRRCQSPRPQPADLSTRRAAPPLSRRLWERFLRCWVRPAHAAGGCGCCARLSTLGRTTTAPHSTPRAADSLRRSRPASGARPTRGRGTLTRPLAQECRWAPPRCFFDQRAGARTTCSRDTWKIQRRFRSRRACPRPRSAPAPRTPRCWRPSALSAPSAARRHLPPPACASLRSPAATRTAIRAGAPGLSPRWPTETHLSAAQARPARCACPRRRCARCAARRLQSASPSCCASRLWMRSACSPPQSGAGC